MKGLAAFQLTLGVMGIFAQARTLSLTYFNLDITIESPDIKLISFGVILEGQYEVLKCRGALDDWERERQMQMQMQRGIVGSDVPYAPARKFCAFESESFLPINVSFTIKQLTSGVKKAGFLRTSWKLRDPLELAIQVDNLINPRNSYTAHLSLPPSFFAFDFDASEWVRFSSKAFPDSAEVSFYTR